MLTKLGNPAPPSGIKLKLFRAPIYLYRIGLGGLLGERFLLLKHRGRRSGRQNETVLEVIHHDKENSTVFVASGFGEKSQWFKNILADNSVHIRLKHSKFDAEARVVSSQEARTLLIQYANTHPKSMKAVARLCGYDMDGSESDIFEFSQIINIVEFTRKRDA
ncbi:MAG: deazaflavin-dependent oxidoreductase (nitroreductase family) [Patiriisocius sp.]